MNMREKMARGMCAADFKALPPPPFGMIRCGPDNEHDYVEKYWQSELLKVDAAFDALADPTPAMLIAGCQESAKEQLRQIDIHRTDAYTIIRAAMLAAKEGK